MLGKRLIGTVLVRSGLAVQSIGYRRWMPLGTPECLVQNLDSWGADGIVVLAIDRGDRGPDLPLIQRLGSLGISTPLTYGGGLRNQYDAKAVVSAGVERLVLDSLLHKDPSSVQAIRMAVGAQALIASLPLVRDSRGSILHWNHQLHTAVPISSSVRQLVDQQLVSELLVIDVHGEGKGLGFDLSLLDYIQAVSSAPTLAFGGIATPSHIRSLLCRPRLAGVLLGNVLNYREHAIAFFKSSLEDLPLRPHTPFGT